MQSTIIIFLIYFSFSDSAPLEASDVSALLGPDCQSEEESAKIVKCAPLLLDYKEKYSIMNATDIELNGTKITGFIALCKKTMICIEPTCLPEAIKDGIYITFLLAEVKNTEFSNCVVKIEKEKPDLSSYDCLKPEDYVNGVIAIPMLETNPDCLKTVVDGYCGEKATVNFDENISKLISAYKLAPEVKAGLNGTSTAR